MTDKNLLILFCKVMTLKTTLAETESAKESQIMSLQKAYDSLESGHAELTDRNATLKKERDRLVKEVMHLDTNLLYQAKNFGGPSTLLPQHPTPTSLFAFSAV
jgi:hypothetical protein